MIALSILLHLIAALATPFCGCHEEAVAVITTIEPNGPSRLRVHCVSDSPPRRIFLREEDPWEVH